MSLASKLPWNHRFAGGYPGLSSQPLPTDADAIDYLSRMATADGAGVETGVAVAVDAFVAALKADSLWDAIGSSCLLSGPRTLAGALVPLRGDAPTAYGFVAGDHSRDTGLQGDGTSYIDSNRNNNADPQDSQHVSVYASIAATSTSTNYPVYIGANDTASGGATHIGRLNNNGALYLRSRQAGVNYSVTGTGSETGFLGLSRGSASTYVARRAQATVTPTAVGSRTSTTPFDGNVFIFGSTANYISNARLAFYSIGSSIDLAALDSHISSYVTAIGAAI
jgi:hypothetical protein